MNLKITAAERGLLLRIIEYSMEQQNNLPFCNSLPSDYWLANGLKEKLYDCDRSHQVECTPPKPGESSSSPGR
jgi:hypothetical protein